MANGQSQQHGNEDAAKRAQMQIEEAAEAAKQNAIRAYNERKAAKQLLTAQMSAAKENLEPSGVGAQRGAVQLPSRTSLTSAQTPDDGMPPKSKSQHDCAAPLATLQHNVTASSSGPSQKASKKRPADQVAALGGTDESAPPRKISAVTSVPSTVKKNREAIPNASGEEERKKCSQAKSKPKKSKQNERKGPKYTASVVVRALGSTSTQKSGLDDVIQRIAKSQARGHHANTPEEEAKTSLFVAALLMQKYHISQAEVDAHTPDSDQKQSKGACSIVSIHHTNGDESKVFNQSFVDDLATAMEEFFEGKSYYQTRSFSIQWTFYGVPTNTVVAAEAFQVAYNKIAEWSMKYKGNPNPARKDYCLGVSEELLRLAEEEKEMQLVRAEKAEREALAAKLKAEEVTRQARLDRLARSSTSFHDEAIDKSSDSEDEGDDDDCDEPDFTAEDERSIDEHADVDKEIDRLLANKQARREAARGATWKSSMQLVKHRESSEVPTMWRKTGRKTIKSRLEWVGRWCAISGTGLRIGKVSMLAKT